MVRESAIVLGTFVVAGVACAFLWHWWWGDPPTGPVVNKHPYFDSDAEFRSTGLYILIAAGVGLLLGLLFSYLFDTDEVITLGTVLVGAAIAGALMAVIGHTLGPESASQVAKHTKDYEQIKADLRVQWGAPWLAFPASALLGSVAVLVTFAKKTDAEPGG